jgi:mannose-6-phosphate isomerase-like protein (cupin superfamily)
MDDFSKAILKELLPVEKDVALPAAGKQSQKADELDHLSLAVLLERATYLRKLAKLGDGSASETLKEYPQHAIMLLFRGRSGIAELHENFADLFLVLEGRAALVTAGSIGNAKTIAPGEIRGDAVQDGVRQELRAGDVAHVPAGVPHQMLVAGDQSIVCLVMKIQQNLLKG